MLYGDGPRGALTPEQARSWTESFASAYYYGLPFEQSTLDAIWRRCRGPECWSAEQEARAALEMPRTRGDSASDGEGTVETRRRSGVS